MNETIEQEIITCDRCLGTTKVLKKTSAYDSEHITCPKCEGRGLLLKTITTRIEVLQASM
jgi:hypothetical protein